MHAAPISAQRDDDDAHHHHRLRDVGRAAHLHAGLSARLQAPARVLRQTPAQAPLPLGREDLSQKMHKIVVDESARCEFDACSIAPPAPCASSLPAGGGWGIPRLAASEDGSALTHFRTSIIKSFIVLEEAFAQRMQMQHQHQHLRGCGAPVLAPATAAIMRCGAVRPLRRCATTCAVCASGCPRYPARSRASTWSITFSEEHISLEAYNQFQALSLNLVVNIKRGG